MPYEQFVERFATWAREKSGSHRCFVAARDNEIIGMAWLAIVKRVPAPLTIERVTVHSSFRAIPAYSRHGFTSSARLMQADVR